MDNTRRYKVAMQAVQAGVALRLEILFGVKDDKLVKDLRVGIESNFVDARGLATLLMEKGIFTLAEYEKAMADAAEQEKADLEAYLSKHYGKRVTLVGY